jgi:hypothetical protein
MHFQQVFVDFPQGTFWWNTLTDLLGAPWLQNLILAVTAAIGLYTLGASSRQERRRATVDVLLELLDDKEFLETRTKVKALIDNGLDIPALLSKEGIENRRLVLSILSRYEFMASGLREGAFDEGVYKRMYYTNVLNDWANLEAFVIALRIDRHVQTPYQELQQLIQRWKKHPLKPYSKWPPNFYETVSLIKSNFKSYFNKWLKKISQSVSLIKSYFSHPPTPSPPLLTKVSRTVSLNVAAPESPTFTMSASPTSAAVALGDSAESTITTAPKGAFDSEVALTASGQPAGVTVTFSPASVAAPGSGTSTMTMAVAPTAPPGTYSIKVTGDAAGSEAGSDPGGEAGVAPQASPTQAQPANGDAAAPGQTGLTPAEPPAPDQKRN